MNISEYASRIGDNRAFVQIDNAVSTAAANMSLDSFFQFSQMIKFIKDNWIEVVFDGIISALENCFFLKKNLYRYGKKQLTISQ